MSSSDTCFAFIHHPPPTHNHPPPVSLSPAFPYSVAWEQVVRTVRAPSDPSFSYTPSPPPSLLPPPPPPTGLPKGGGQKRCWHQVLQISRLYACKHATNVTRLYSSAFILQSFLVSSDLTALLLLLVLCCC